MLAADTLRRVGHNLGVPDFLEVTVEESEQMDLAEFDRCQHSGVILDGIADALFLKRNRETLQGRPKVVRGAKSATNMYSYCYSFCGRAVVATFDLSAKNLDQLWSDHWLSNRDNVQLLHLEEPAYVDPQTSSQAPASPGARVGQQKRRWVASPKRELCFVETG